MRLREGDFHETQHKGGVSPAWPIDYQDLKPFYDEAEILWKVHGARGVDPAEPAGSPAYAYPAIPDDPGVGQLRTHFETQGWKPFSLPLGVDWDGVHPLKTPCIKCKTCGGYPCLLKAKCDARTRAVEPAMAYPNVTLLTGRKAVRVKTDASGKTVTSVITEGVQGEETWTGDIVVLAAGAVNTAVLLLASATDQHPNGLANGSDQVGRNYVFHTPTAMVS
jgi:choline dehydrogenase-like flavoprotein